MNILLLNLFARAADGRLRGATLETPRWYRPVLVIPCRVGRRTLYLSAVLEAPGPFVHIATERPLEGARAPQRFEALAGRRVVAVSAPARDRLLQVDVDAPASGTSGPMSLLFHLYGAQATVQLRRDESTLDSVGGRRRPEDRGGRRPSLVDIDAADLAGAVEGVADPAGLRRAVPGLEASLAAAFPAPSGTEGAVDPDAVIRFRDALLAEETPLTLAAGRRLSNAVPVPAGSTVTSGSIVGHYDGAEAATRAVGEQILGEAKRHMVTGLARPVKRRLDTQKKLLENLHHDLERARGHERLRREAEILAAYQSTIRTGEGTVELPDPYLEGTTVTIVLDPALPVRAQIEKRFKKATKLEKSETHTRRRIELVEREVRELDAALKVLDRSESFARALMHLEAIRSRFDIEATPRAPAARKRRNTEGTGTPYRRFELGDGWFALVGKGSRENDELTFRHASPEDLWLHAQSVPGSHVVLKSPGPPTPPPRILEAAASIAAHFSKARHSNLVPVIYTRRKYVRKFRGSSPGEVQCEREKMLMVEPVLPPDTAADPDKT